MKYCNFCNGSGEGAYDGSICSVCKGIGINRHAPPESDDDDWRYDAKLEERLRTG